MAALRRCIAIIGDSTIVSGSAAEQRSERLGMLLVDAGYRLVTGGSGGIMEAACRGAHASPNHHPGAVIGLLPGDDTSAANRYVDVAIATRLGHLRNALVASSDAVIALGGGAGTLAEMAFAWIFDKLLLAFRLEGWSGRLADTRIDQRTRFARIPDDRVYGVDTPEQAIAVLQAQLPRYLAPR